ncbi:LysE/ArgO family amino acid transporter [Amnibacterium soli]|uniref:LysE/ArgO family amino acid transporter n=1 Tax=Amnibacterium soli TaxID=1282736 RepID=A0ABP8ZCJ5_9MICO
MPPLLALLAGLGTGLGLIVAIGAQNAYLLRLSATASRRTTAAAVLVCAGSDAVLIVAGVLGVGVVVQHVPVALLIARLAGAAFLLTYGVFAVRRVLRPTGAGLGAEAEEGEPPSLAAGGTRVLERSPRTAVRPVRALLTIAVFTWANPHVYLDTLVFLGSVGTQQPADVRWWWVAGAVAASCLWFSAIGFGGRLLAPLLARPAAWRVLDGLIAVVMIALGLSLLLGA